MTLYYVVVQGLRPGSVTETGGEVQIVPRHWGVGVWDWAFLATEHELGLPFQVADVMARSVNLELCVNAVDRDDAVAMLAALKLCLAGLGVHPFAAPMISTHSINDFSNIKGSAQDPSDARYERAKALATKAETVITWPIPGSPVVARPMMGKNELDSETLRIAVTRAKLWRSMAEAERRLRVIENAAVSAAEIANLGQGILQMWTGLESLFPTVHAELSFRLALYLAQLNASNGDRLSAFHEARDAYSVRSKIAHGHDMSEPTERNRHAWSQAWSLLHRTIGSLIDRGCLPTENELVEELLTPAGAMENE
ncbi:hypothetical protein [Nocardia sp. NPDC047654]|uniref:hypothetical protein n=1 Tax=Nocardia sp. NPDC047654 TaxID=3364314 RepID=UPI00371B40C6